MSTTTNNTVILKGHEDWEGWFGQLKSGVEKHIWRMINPQNEEDIEELPYPEKPLYSHFHEGANSYQALPSAAKKDYDQARRYYESDMKDYRAQQDRLTTVRKEVFSTISSANRAQLRDTQSTKEWLQILMTGSKPTDTMAKSSAKQRYQRAIKPLRQSSKPAIYTWIQEWETAMAEGQRHNVPECLDNTSWLTDFCMAITHISPAFATSYKLKITEEEYTNILYLRVGSAFRS